MSRSTRRTRLLSPPRLRPARARAVPPPHVRARARPASRPAAAGSSCRRAAAPPRRTGSHPRRLRMISSPWRSPASQ
eukprot:4213653-Pleurochrysis_carterae.AAC.4